MKQIAIPALIAVALSTLTACGSDDPPAAQQPAATVTTADDGETADGTAVAGGDSTVADTATVEIDSSRFDQRELRVEAGTTVAFVNNDPYAHTVTAAADSPIEFDSGEFGQDETFEFVFDEPGEYPYFCRIHPTMRAVVIVE